MNYLEYYKLTFGWILSISYNLIFAIGVITVLKWLFLDITVNLINKLKQKHLKEGK